jgi:hypothetical protein
VAQRPAALYLQRLFFDDVTGKGHITRAITDLHVALINRACA